MRRLAAIGSRAGMVAVPLLATFGEMKGQFDYGLMAGAFISEAREWKSEGNGYGRIVVPGTPFTTLSVFYTERTSHLVDFSASLDYTHKEFHATSGRGGLGSGDVTDLHVKQEMLHLSIGADLHAGRAMSFRIALQAGAAFTGHMSGRSERWTIGTNSIEHIYDRAPLSGGNGDLRLLLATRAYMISDEPWFLAIEPYLSYGLTSMVRDPGPKTTDIGMRLGLARHSTKRAASYLVPRGPKTGY